MKVIRYEYDPCVMDGTVKSMIYGFITIFQQQESLFVLSYSNPIQINVATQKTSLLYGLKMS